VHPLLKLREFFYNKEIFSSVSLPAFTISVGNISLGGSGKSPLCDLICSFSEEKKKSLLLLSRGYGRESKEVALILANESLVAASFIGDEPWMIKNKHPGIKLLVHSDRGVKAQENWEKCSAEIVLLDDAFQHWKIKRDIDIVLVDAYADLEQATLPFGALRETKEALLRADIIILSRSQEVSTEQREILLSQLNTLAKNPRKKSNWRRNFVVQKDPLLLEMNYAPKYLGNKQKQIKIEELQNKNCILVSGIAKGKSFAKSVEACGAKVLDQIEFSDHSLLSQRKIIQVTKVFEKWEKENPWILITEKDWARWHDKLSFFPKNTYYFSVGLEFAEKGQEKLFSALWDAYQCIKF